MEECFYLSQNKLSFEAALVFCDQKGGRLYEPKIREMNKKMGEYFDNNNMTVSKTLWTKYRVNWNTSKGNQAPIKNLKNLVEKSPNLNLVFPSVKNSCPQLT